MILSCASRRETNLTAVSHLTCVCHAREELAAILDRYAASGVENILALGGDPPRNKPNYDRSHDAFQYADQLVRFIREQTGPTDPRGFGIGVAGFPEGHPGTPNRLQELDYLKRKIDAGSDYICTQLFFVNHDFYDFRERCELAGITVPIIAGIMPVTSNENMSRMAELALGARIPARLLRAIDRCGEDPRSRRQGRRSLGYRAMSRPAGQPGSRASLLHAESLRRHQADLREPGREGFSRARIAEASLIFPLPMTTEELTLQLKAKALELGFDRVGVAPAVAAPGHDRFREWLRAGHAAGMAYLHRQAEARQHPDHVLEGVRSIVMASVVYGRPLDRSCSAVEGMIARYARGPIITAHSGIGSMSSSTGCARSARVFAVEPSLTRRRSWSATSLVLPGWAGSARTPCSSTASWAASPSWAPCWLTANCFLIRLIVPDHCGTCTRCLDACPTDAFAGPYRLDSRRCISFWTIEHKGPVPEEIASTLNGWVFGCDVCQDVCPWNRKAPAGRMAQLEEGRDEPAPNLIEWLDRDVDSWKKAIKGTAPGACQARWGWCATRPWCWESEEWPKRSRHSQGG